MRKIAKSDKKKNTWFYKNPSKRSKEFADQLKSGKGKDGSKLTDTQKAFRSGYLSRGTDSATAYKLKNK